MAVLLERTLEVTPPDPAMWQLIGREQRTAVHAKPLTWGLIGASDIAATRVIPALHEAGHTVAAVYSSDSQRGAAYAAANGVPASAASLGELLDMEIDAVYISTRNDLHRQQVEAAARAGKHVLCEKPLAASVTDAAALVDACRTAGVVLATDHHQRGAATVRAIARLIGEGAIGRPLAARVQHAVLLPERLRGWRLTDPRAGAGVILDITCHDVDTLRFVLGHDPIEAIGLAARQGLAQDGIEDSSMSVLRFEGDLLASTHDAFTTPNAGTALEVHGTEGSLVGDGILSQDPVGDVTLLCGSKRSTVGVGRRENLYVRTLRDFAAAVAGEPSPISTGHDGLIAMTAAASVVEAARTGRITPIEYRATR